MPPSNLEMVLEKNRKNWMMMTQENRESSTLTENLAPEMTILLTKVKTRCGEIPTTEKND